MRLRPSKEKEDVQILKVQNKSHGRGWEKQSWVEKVSVV